MKTKQWLTVATLASALAMAGTALAHGDRDQDKDQLSRQEHAGAAVNDNSAAQLGSGVNGNSAAQLGTEASKATVPNDSEATEGSDKAPANDKTLIEQSPSTDTTKAAPARSGSDVRPGNMGPANARGE